MFGQSRRVAIKQRAKLMGRMVMLLTDGLCRKSYDQFVDSYSNPTSPMKLNAMLAYRDSKCGFHRVAGTRRRHRYTRTRNLGCSSRAVAMIVVFASVCPCRLMPPSLPVL